MSIKLIYISPNEWTEIQGFSSKGRRVKSWYERISDGEVYLYKEPKKYISTNFVTKEIWTELLAYEIGVFLGLNIPEAIPATDGEHYGVLIKSFLKRGDAGMPAVALAEASDILSYAKIAHPHNLKTIKFLSQTPIVEKNLWTKYRKMLIFDCIIGNNDRHDENWGLLYGSELQQLVFAPIYDNASCLTAGETDDKVELLSQDKAKLEQFVNNSKPPNLYLNDQNLKHYKHFEIMEYLLKTEPDMKELVEEMVNKDYLSYTESILAQINRIDVPEVYKLTDTRCKVILQILECRQQKLKDLINVYI